MYYDKQPPAKQQAYKDMLNAIGRLSRMFSENRAPYLAYRAHENIFAKYFEIENNARHDDSADAYDLEARVGIGLKTWMGNDDQKVAEFGRQRPLYEHLDGLELIIAIAQFRNERIQTTKNAHGLNELIYHIVKRTPGQMGIYESAFDEIDIDHIELQSSRGTANNIYFTDGRHTYHFSRSKNTLYMDFSHMQKLDSFEVVIDADPFDFLATTQAAKRASEATIVTPKPHDCLCLRLYTLEHGIKTVAPKSGLNQWNGARNSYSAPDADGKRTLLKSTPRHEDELYIPYPKVDRERKSFFPPRNVHFDLRLPNGRTIQAKVCQQDGKAIMSNPNQDLGHWLLRDVFELEPGELVTYELLQRKNVDSAMFTKTGEGAYSIEFCELGTYEKFYGLADADADYDAVSSDD